MDLQAGTSVVLQNNGGDNLTVAQSGGFTFPNGFAPGSNYAVTVLTNPQVKRAWWSTAEKARCRQR